MIKMEACKHFNGIIDHSKICGLKIDIYNTVDHQSPGMALRLPCITTERSEKGRITCGSYCQLTPEEKAAKAARDDDLIEEASYLTNQIRDKFGRDQLTIGHVDCPICGHSVQYTVAVTNQHIHAICETEDCIRFMQ